MSRGSRVIGSVKTVRATPRLGKESVSALGGRGWPCGTGCRGEPCPYNGVDSDDINSSAERLIAIGCR